MRPARLLACAIAGVLAASSAHATTGGLRILLWGKKHKAAAAGPVPGQPISLLISSAQLPALGTSDLGSNAHILWDSYTADLTISQFATGGTLAAYTGLFPAVNPTPSSNALSFTDHRPGFSPTDGSATTVDTTVFATTPIRQPYPNITLPTEGTSAGNAIVTVGLSAAVRSGDTLGPATLAANLNGASLAGTIAPASIAAGALASYEPPIMEWKTDAGMRIGPSDVGFTGFTVEIVCGQEDAWNGHACAGVNFTLSDTGGHNVTHWQGVPSISKRSLSTQCTATTGSAILTGCASTVGFLPGARLSIAGVAGQPKLKSVDSSTQMTMGDAATCTTTLNSGIVTITNAPVAGDGFADGGFKGATITDANILTSTSQAAGSAKITATPSPANGTYSGTTTKFPTALALTTDALTSTAATSAPCVINDVYQGVTGTVNVYFGDPFTVFATTFNSTDFTTVSTDGVLTIEAVGKPYLGNVTTDTAAGADGTNLDWFWINLTAPYTAAQFAATSVSPNLHNLWAYRDGAGTSAPKYAWVNNGAAGGAPAVQTASADPGAAAYYGTFFAAVTALKAAYGGTSAHGGVVCLLASTYTTKGGATNTLANTANKPPLTITSAVTGSPCPGPSPNGLPGLGGAPSTAIFGHDATAANNNVGFNWHWNNLTFSGGGAAILSGIDSGTANVTAFSTTENVFSNDYITTTAGGGIFFFMGCMDYYNNVIDQHAGDGFVLQVSGGRDNVACHVTGNTIISNTFSGAAPVATWILFNSTGNVGWGASPKLPAASSVSAVTPQPLSVVNLANKYMGLVAPVAFDGATTDALPLNILTGNNVYECFLLGSGAGQPCEQISGDNANQPAKNIFEFGETVVGGRGPDLAYDEGLGLIVGTGTAKAVTAANCVTAGFTGAFAAASYFAAVTYSAPGGTTEEAWNGVTQTAVAVAANGCLTVTVPRVSPIGSASVRKAWIYAGTTSTLTNFATNNVSGDLTQVAEGATYTLTNIGSAAGHNAGTGLNGLIAIKQDIVSIGTLSTVQGTKNDTYAASGVFASGYRTGNWFERFGPGRAGSATAVCCIIGTSAPSATSLIGDWFGWQAQIPGSYTPTDISKITYSDDGSCGLGNLNNCAALATGSDLGQRNYCVLSSSTYGPNEIPAGYAFWDIDIQGRPRANDGTGYAGAYEGGCI